MCPSKIKETTWMILKNLLKFWRFHWVFLYFYHSDHPLFSSWIKCHSLLWWCVSKKEKNKRTTNSFSYYSFSVSIYGDFCGSLQIMKYRKNINLWYMSNSFVDHCLYFCPFSYLSFFDLWLWLPLWYLRFMASDYPFGILDIWLLITPLVS